MQTSLTYLLFFKNQMSVQDANIVRTSASLNTGNKLSSSLVFSSNHNQKDRYAPLTNLNDRNIKNTRIIENGTQKQKQKNPI